MNTRIPAALSLILLASCVSVQVQQRPGAAEADRAVRTPKAFVTVDEPVQEPTEVEGLYRAPNIDRNLFYYEKDRAWYRWAYGRWFQAFRWDGKWYEMPEQALPAALLQADVDRAPVRSVRDTLRDQERALEEIDKQERLRQLEERMKQIEESEEKGDPED